MYWLLVIGIPAALLFAGWLFVLFVQFLYRVGEKAREEREKEMLKGHRSFRLD